MVMRLLYREFPGWRKAGVNLGSQPLAEGSVAILMPFVWQKAGGGEPTQGVFKFLKPAIEDILAEELAIWDRLGRFLDDNCARYHLPEIHYQDTFQTVRDLLVHEVHLEEEQKHLLEAAEEYAGMDSVVVPGLLPFNSRRMTAMVRLRGVTLGESIDTQPAMGHATQWQTLRPSPIGWERENLRQSWHESNHFINKNELPAPALASVIAEALVARPLFSAHSAALFHGDPHAGNLFLTTDGQLGLLDWSLGGRLQKSERIELIQFLIGALSFDESRMQSAIGKLSRDTGDSKAVAEVLKGGLREMRWGRPLGLRWLTDLLDNLVARGRVRFNPDLLLFRKSLLTLEGVLADVVGGEQAAGEAALNQAFLAVLIGQLLREWPLRIKGPLDSRQFKTHLSTADLMSLFFSGPATMTHYWSCAWLDWLGLAT
jgi:ubiquinone biosynthesis protein